MDPTDLSPENRPARLVALMLLGVVGARVAVNTYGRPGLLPSLAVLGLLLAILLAEGGLPRGPRLVTHLSLLVQTGLVLSLGLFRPYLDISASLLILPLLHAVRSLPPRPARCWVAALAGLVVASECLGLGLAQGVPVSLMLIAGGTFFASFDVLYRQAEVARRESQALLGDLRDAHQKLQAYAAQVEELAAAEQRAQVAHALHDLVNQVLFSITLTAQSARLLLEKDPPRAAEQLDRLVALTAEALAKMRSLITDLRPKT